MSGNKKSENKHSIKKKHLITFTFSIIYKLLAQ